MGLDWAATRELIARSAERPAAEGGSVACRRQHRPPRAGADRAVDRDHRRYKEQLHFAEGQGARSILMASRHLAAAAATRRRLPPRLRRGARPGQPSRSSCTGWARCSTRRSPATAAATTWPAPPTVPRDHREHADKIDGVKMSLLDAAPRSRCASACPAGCGCSPVTTSTTRTDRRRRRAPLRRAAGRLRRDHSGRLGRDPGARRRRPPSYRALIGPTEELSRQVFAAPTFYYKTGVAFLSWLNGHQPAFRWSAACRRPGRRRTWPGSSSSPTRAGLLPDPELAGRRLGWSSPPPGSHVSAPAASTVADPTSRGSRSTSDHRRAGPCARRSTAPGRPGCPASGCGASGWPRSAWTTPRGWLADSGLRVSSLCRGGFLTAADRRPRGRARRQPGAIDEAATLGAGELCSSPAACPRRSRPAGARDGGPRPDRELVPYARARRPAGDRAAAPDVRRRPCRRLDPRSGARHRRADPADARRRRRRHLPRLVGPRRWQAQIARAGGRIASYQVCDWMTSDRRRRAAVPRDDGRRRHRLRLHRRWVRDAGYRGDIEVEIFNDDIWATDGDEVLATMAGRYLDLVLPYA